MGWKYTETITRKKAIELIEARLYEASNEELSNALEYLGYGDNVNLCYYGRNFTVVDEINEKGEYINENNKNAL